MLIALRRTLDQVRHLAVAVTQQHHEDLVPLIGPLIPAGGTVVDVGAHAGQFAKLFSRMVGPRGIVHAFEPSAYTRNILETALRANGCRNVTVHAAGLSDAPGELTLHTPIKARGGRGFGLASMGGVADGRFAITERVPVSTLDSFVSERDLKLDFIKADIEGWEGRLLRGAETTMREQRPALLLEIDDQLMTRAGDSAAELFDWLLGMGYRAITAADATDVAGYVGPADYLFRR